MATLRLLPRVSWGLAAFACSVAISGGCAAQLQSADEVHVTPPSIREAPPPDAASADSELKLRNKPVRVDVDLVQVPVTVVDPVNRPVTSLQKRNFTVYEDNQPQEIQYFSAEEAPISIGLILDLSKSMSNKLVTEREAVEQFFNNANSQDDYFAVSFADAPRLLASASQSIDDIQQKLKAAIPDGHTALLDAVYLAVSKMRSAKYDRKALLIISDGGDNHSRYGLKEIKSLVQEADVEVYAIGIFDSLMPFQPFEELMGKRWLSEITDATGGRTVSVNTLAKMPEAAAAISREMRAQYVLGYRPRDLSRDGRWRKIKVQVTPPDRQIRVRAYYKKGYLAPSR